MKDFKSILFATDFSESSDHAFDYAFTVAKKFNARLIVLHIINELADLRGFYVPHISIDKLEEEMAESAGNMMDKFIKMHTKGYDRVESLVVPGIPYDEILKKAEEESVDMIVLGTHGRTGLDHVLFGSTAEKVVRKSNVPVMTIRIR
ncbi:MAG: universal stress protein [Desulfuromonadales bacterium]|nr:universal stress protein [Desulfuromonadales bacterium]